MYKLLGAFLLLSICVSAHNYCDPDDVHCLLKHDKRNISLVSVRPELNASLPCRAFTQETHKSVEKVEWWFGRRSKLIGTWSNDGDLNSERYSFGANSSLLAINVDHELVEE
jgi:hypothetical protein